MILKSINHLSETFLSIHNIYLGRKLCFHLFVFFSGVLNIISRFHFKEFQGYKFSLVSFWFSCSGTHFWFLVIYPHLSVSNLFADIAYSVKKKDWEKHTAKKIGNLQSYKPVYVSYHRY